MMKILAAALLLSCAANAQDPLSADDAKPGREALCREQPERCQTVEEARRECSHGGKNCAALKQQTKSDREQLEEACAGDAGTTAVCEKKRAEVKKREQKCAANPPSCQ